MMSECVKNTGNGKRINGSKDQREIHGMKSGAERLMAERKYAVPFRLSTLDPLIHSTPDPFTLDPYTLDPYTLDPFTPPSHTNFAKTNTNA
jgi:hypothetical protein